MTQLTLRLPPLPAAIRLCLAAMTAAAALPAAAAPDTVRVIVSFKAGHAPAATAALNKARVTIKHEIIDSDAIAVEVPVSELQALRNHPDVDFVEEDAKRYPLALANPAGRGFRNGQVVPYGIKMVQADKLPDTHTGNRTVCIIDSGYDRAHEDLADNRVSGGYDAGTGWWHTDELHHGTHVAGTVAAINNWGTGVVGVAPNRRLRLHIVKVFGADGWAYSSTLASAARLCGKAGANIISMSLGGGTPSRVEMRAFDHLAAKGVLSIAAAGNDGDSSIIFPAGYASVLMVGALDVNKTWASFSQYNEKVELAGPGVNVLSTVPMNSGAESFLKVGATTYAPGGMDESPKTTVSAPLADFGIGDALNPAMAGKVCLIKRGEITFGLKVANCQSSGGLGAVVFNNADASFSGTLGGVPSAIAAVTASGIEGAALLAQLGQPATLKVAPASYAYFDGTSMATPHVAAVAALVWSYYPGCSASQIRSSLTKSALDLGAPGRDDKYGYGLVQAKAAYLRIAARGCGN